MCVSMRNGVEESRNARGENSETQVSRIYCNARGGNTVTEGVGCIVTQGVEIQLMHTVHV